MDNLKEITLKVCELAKATGDFIRNERKLFSEDKVEKKGSHDYVSYVDKAAETIIVKRLKELCPEAGFITEENTVGRTDTELNWIIDPLDGTTNFIQDQAPYCVSLALRRGSDILIGVVYEVCRDECFYAWKGGGAYMNGKTIHVSEKGMDNAFIGLDLPYKAEEFKPTLLHLFTQLYGKVVSLRIIGSAAMGLCYVAIGRYDGWAEGYIQVWDYAAGALIVREAGGVVTDFEGDESIVDTQHIIATNGVIQQELKNVIKTGG